MKLEFEVVLSHLEASRDTAFYESSPTIVRAVLEHDFFGALVRGGPTNLPLISRMIVVGTNRDFVWDDFQEGQKYLVTLEKL